MEIGILSPKTAFCLINTYLPYRDGFSAVRFLDAVTNGTIYIEAASVLSECSVAFLVLLVSVPCVMVSNAVYR